MLITSTSVLSHSISAPGPSRVSPPVSPPRRDTPLGLMMQLSTLSHQRAPHTSTASVSVFCVCV